MTKVWLPETAMGTLESRSTVPLPREPVGFSPQQ